MIDKIELEITEYSHPLLYYNSLILKPSKQYKLFLTLNVVNQRLEKTSQLRYAKLTLNTLFGQQSWKTLGNALALMKNLYQFDLTIKQYNNFEDNGIMGLIEGLSSLQNLKRFQLCVCGKNFISENGIKQLTNNFYKLSNLEYFKFQVYKQNIVSGCVCAIFEGLEHIIMLETLKLHFINTKLKEDDFQFIGNQLIKINALTNLDLFLPFENDAFQNGIVYLTQGLSSLLNLQKLNLSFAANNIGGDLVINTLNQSILKLTNLRCLKLYLPRTYQLPNDCDQICNGFENLNNLQHLVIRFPTNPHYTKLFFEKIFINLKNCEEITKLKLQIDSQHVILLIGLLAFLTNLEPSNFHLGKMWIPSLKRNKQTKQIESSVIEKIDSKAYDIKDIIEVYRHFSQLKSLIFFYPKDAKFDQECILLFSEQMKLFNNLTYFKFDLSPECNIQSKGMITFAYGLKYLVNLEELVIQIQYGNHIEHTSMQILFQSLTCLPFLKYFSLSIESFNKSFICQEENLLDISKLQQLKNMQFSIYQDEIDVKGSIVLLNWFSCMEQLEELSFNVTERKTQDTSTHAQIYQNMAKGIQKLQRIKKLNLSNNQNFEILKIGTVANNQLFSNLCFLRLEFNISSHQFFQELTMFLSQLQNLEELNLNIYSLVYFTIEGVNQLKMSFFNLKKLKVLTLNLISQMIGLDINKILKELVYSFTTIEHLHILHSQISYFQRLKNLNRITKRKCKRLVIQNYS